MTLCVVVPFTAAVGLGLGAVGAAMIGVGAKARRDVRDALSREQITAVGGMAHPGAPGRSPATRGSLAEVIRSATIEAAGGLTYSETPPFLDSGGQPTADAERALNDQHTGQPVQNPSYELWIRSTTLQSALMQAYVGFRVAEFTAAVGAAFALAGLGLAVAGRPCGHGRGGSIRPSRRRRCH